MKRLEKGISDGPQLLVKLKPCGSGSLSNSEIVERGRGCGLGVSGVYDVTPLVVCGCMFHLACSPQTHHTALSFCSLLFLQPPPPSLLRFSSHSVLSLRVLPGGLYLLALCI